MINNDLDVSANTTIPPNPLDFTHFKTTYFGIKIRDRNIFYFRLLEDGCWKSISLMIGKHIFSWDIPKLGKKIE